MQNDRPLNSFVRSICRQVRLSLKATVLALLIAAASKIGYLSAQEFRSTLSGQVLDSSGGAIVHAQIIAIRSDSQQSYRAATTSTGSYYIPYVLPGNYTVTVSAHGFARPKTGKRPAAWQ